MSSSYKRSSVCRFLTLTDRQLLTLLRAALIGTSTDKDAFEKNTDWEAIRMSAHRQTVAALAFDAVERLPDELRPRKEILLPWYGFVQKVEQENKRLENVLAEAVGRYHKAGLHPILLKGQGLARLYPNPMRRQPGDIDLFFGDDYERANREAENWENVRFHPETTYHRSFDWRGVTIENHLRYVDFYHPSNRRAWRKIEQAVPLLGNEKFTWENGSIPVPAPQMNALYVLLHLLHHFFQVGIGLRQLCDWVCLLRTRQKEIDMRLLRECTDALHVTRAATALARIAEDTL